MISSFFQRFDLMARVMSRGFLCTLIALELLTGVSGTHAQNRDWREYEVLVVDSYDDFVAEQARLLAPGSICASGLTEVVGIERQFPPSIAELRSKMRAHNIYAVRPLESNGCSLNEITLKKLERRDSKSESVCLEAQRVVQMSGARVGDCLQTHMVARVCCDSD